MISRGPRMWWLASVVGLVLAAGCQSGEDTVSTASQVDDSTATTFDRSHLTAEDYLPTQVRSATATDLAGRADIVAVARLAARRPDALVTRPEAEDISGASDVYDALEFDVVELLKGDPGVPTVTVLVPTLVLNKEGTPVSLRSYGAQDIPPDMVGREFLVFLAKFQGEYAFMGEDGVALISDGRVVDTPYAPSDEQDPLTAMFGIATDTAVAEISAAQTPVG